LLGLCLFVGVATPEINMSVIPDILLLLFSGTLKLEVTRMQKEFCTEELTLSDLAEAEGIA
jgi:hypothetical protein